MISTRGQNFVNYSIVQEGASYFLKVYLFKLTERYSGTYVLSRFRLLQLLDVLFIDRNLATPHFIRKRE